MVPQEGQLAQSLHDRVVVHHDHRLVLADAGNLRADLVRQIELAAFPVARQVWRSALDRAILTDDPRAADADQRRQAQAALAGPANDASEHPEPPLPRL